VTAHELRKPRWPLVLAVLFAVAAATVTWAWNTDSGYYAFLPDKAHPTAPIVKVPGEKPQAAGSGLYFVDVNVLKANEVQRLWAEHLVDGASLVPADHILAPGENEQERIRSDDRAMADSKTTAQVVAERAAGMDVKIDKLGAQITALVPGYPPAKAGIKPGQIITRAQGQRIDDATQLVHALAGVRPGQPIALGFSDGTRTTMTSVKAPDDPSRAIVGIDIGDAVKVAHVPVKTTISTPGIGGPSAGLAFALEIYDALTRRTLLHGHKVVATGELDLAGGVHAIGGVEQKTVGAIEAGADTFLVPKDNYKDAAAAADGRITVISVSTFNQALDAIRTLKPVGH
jgi:PDZ domain-containing protein